MAATPAYTAVAARQTLQRPAPPTPSVKPQKVTWSKDVREYVQRAFDPVSIIDGISRDAMQEKLKDIITQAAESGRIDHVDWSQYPLPQHLIRAERNEMLLHGASATTFTDTNSYAPRMNGSQDVPVTNDRKRKSLDNDDPEAEDAEITPPWKKKNTNGDLSLRITGRDKKSDKKQKKASEMRIHAVENNTDVVEKRRQRFGYVTPDLSPHVSSRDRSPDTVPSGPLVGTCENLEKNYFRLTAPPPADTVRPLRILERALDLVRKKWRKEHNYTYACDQLKSIRQDLTVQHIKNEFTVKVYEAHGRIALEMADLGEYNQCQTQLRALYKLNLGGNPDEFMAYRILYFIYTCNRTDMNDVLADLTPADKQKHGVRHALQVRSALASGNYHKFFRLYDEAPFMGPYLLDMFIQRERLAALAAVCRAYKPDVSLHFLTTELAFHGDADADPSDTDAGPRECLEFLCRYGAEQLIERKDTDVRVLTGKAGAIFETAKASAFRRVDIKGQI